MKLQTKFISISIISILLVLVLVYTSYSTINTLEEDAVSIKNAYLTQINQLESDRLHDNIRSSVVRIVIAASSTNQADELKDASSSLDEYINGYKEVVATCIKTKLPAEIHQNYVQTGALLDDFINQASSIAKNPIAPETKSRLAAFGEIFNKIDTLTDTLTNQITKLVDNIANSSDNLDKQAKKIFIIISITSLIFISILPFFTISNIFTPQEKLLNVMHLILGGNDQQEIPYLTRTDELGNMAQALEKFRHSSMEKKNLEKQSKNLAIKSEEERRNNLLNFANNFEKTVKIIVDMVAAAATEMDVTAKDLEAHSKSSQDETRQLSITSAQTNTNVLGVSKATNEFTQSVNEISSQVNNSREYTRKASEQTDKVSGVVNELESKAKAVSGIIDIINNITSQIDLLALNATIEAARAGDMGKGFAVVANEVKALATQTSKATEQINIQISGIQSSTEKAVVSIQEITESVKTINLNTSSIASAVEKQSTTSSYIAENLSKVASMSNTVESSIEKVAKSSAHSGNAASQMVGASGDLLKQASILQKEVDKFLSSLRIA